MITRDRLSVGSCWLKIVMPHVHRSEINPHASPVFEEFSGASYADRYNILCRKLAQEQLYSAASMLFFHSRRNRYREITPELSEMTGLRTHL